MKGKALLAHRFDGMFRQMPTIGFVLAAVGLGFPASATESCPPDSWFAKKERPSAEWAAKASWIAVGQVISRQENIQPYPNCYLPDRSQCAMEDRSVVTVKVHRVVKGAIGKAVPLVLSSAYCGPPPPKEVGTTYTFYGIENGYYIYFKK